MRFLPSAISLSVAAFFGWLFYERYWRWRHCIAEALSSCVTPDGDNLVPAGAMWSIPALLFLLLAIVLWWGQRQPNTRA